MKSKTSFISRTIVRSGTAGTSKALLLFTAATLAATLGLRAADQAAAQKLLAEAKAKEAQAQELRAAAAASQQKAADDQMEAGVAERDARILTAQALKAMGADANKQRAFTIRQEARRITIEQHNMLIAARNDEQKAAQLTHNAEELRKSAAQLKDQPAVAATLENEAKQADADAAKATQAASGAKTGAEGLDQQAKTAWAAAEKLDPETHSQLAPAAPKPVVSQPRPVH